MKYRVFYAIAILILILASFLIVTVFLMLFIPRDIISVRHQPYLVATPVVKAGSDLVYIADICKHVEAVAQVQRSFVNGSREVTPLLASPSGIKAGCGATHVVIHVPETLKPGRYYLNLDVSYDVNALRKDVIYHLHTDWFTVVQ